MSREVDPGLVVRRRSDLVVRTVGTDSVMMDVESGYYFALDEVSTRIWELLEQPITFPRVAEILVAEYEVSEERAREDVIVLFKQLLANKLIEPQS